MDAMKVIGMILLLSASLFCGCLGGETPEEDLVVSEGDIVKVDYVGRLADGLVFDTSEEEVAREEGVYDAFRDYAPLEFQVGGSQVIPGFENAVLGMRVGENKTVLVSPSEAYGRWDEEKTDVANKTQTSPRFEEIERSVFEERLGAKAFVGMEYTTAPYEWDRTVVNVSDSYVLIRHDPVNGSVIETFLGDAVVIVDDVSLYFRFDPQVGDVVATPAGRGLVTAVSDESFTVDFNHPLAGKSLEFYIEVVDIVRAG